jgi:8-amino-7-oxononanoate synthase
MRTIFVTGTDTGIGKTRVVAALARLLSAQGGRIQIVKALETGWGDPDESDARKAWRLAGTSADACTLVSFKAPLSPLAAAAAEGRRFTLAELQERLEALPACDWRIIEGAGGLAVPLMADGRDWIDFAKLVEVDPRVVLVVPNRLGAINQARMAHAYAEARGLEPLIWLNENAPVDADVSESNFTGLCASGLTPFAIQHHGDLLPENPSAVVTALTEVFVGRVEAATCDGVAARCRDMLATREQQGLRRALRVFAPAADGLNLADNDYLALAHDAEIAVAVARAAVDHGTSASASPLITGWHAPHERLVETLCAWHGLPHGLLWSSGYAANAAILGTLPVKGDLVLADRFIHHSMVAGLLRSGARLKRYPHLDLDALETELSRAGCGRTVFVVTESVFYTGLAHALGWYGPQGAGLVREAGVERDVDVLVGTCGKALASGGAYALFNDEAVRDALVNLAGEFVYSTGLPCTTVAAAEAAVGRIRKLATSQAEWRVQSRVFRAALRAEGWDAPEGDSPIVPVKLGAAEDAVALAAALRERGIFAAAVRPPTVPAGTSRLRFSLKRTFGAAEAERVLAVLREGRVTA